MPWTSEPRLVERWLLIAGCVVFLHLVLFRDGTFVYLFHKASTGAWVDEGTRVLDGQVPYRDFSETIGPGLVYLNAAILGLLGRSLDALAWAGLAMGVLVTALLHALSCRVVASRWRLLPPLLFAVVVYPPYDLGSHRWPALALGILGLLALARREPGTTRDALAAGAAFGLATLFTLETGAGIALGTAFYLVRERSLRRDLLAATLIGWLAPVAVVMGGFAVAAGGLGPVRGWALAWLLEARGRPLDLALGWGPRPATYLAMAGGGLLSAIAVLRARMATAPEVEARSSRLVAFAGLGLLIAAVPRGIDPYALGSGSSLLAVCLAQALEDRRAASRPVLAWSRRALLAVLAVGLLHGSLGFVIWRQVLQRQNRQRFRAGTAWNAVRAPEFDWIESRTAPGDPIFVFPAGGMYYFLTRTRNPTSFPYMVEGRVTADEQRRALAEIRVARPAVGLWLGAQRFAVPAGRPALDTLYRGILETYEPEQARPDGTLLLRPRARPGAGVRLLRGQVERLGRKGSVFSSRGGPLTIVPYVLASGHFLSGFGEGGHESGMDGDRRGGGVARLGLCPRRGNLQVEGPDRSPRLARRPHRKSRLPPRPRRGRGPEGPPEPRPRGVRPALDVYLGAPGGAFASPRLAEAYRRTLQAIQLHELEALAAGDGFTEALPEPAAIDDGGRPGGRRAPSERRDAPHRRRRRCGPAQRPLHPAERCRPFLHRPVPGTAARVVRARRWPAAGATFPAFARSSPPRASRRTWPTWRSWRAPSRRTPSRGPRPRASGSSSPPPGSGSACARTGGSTSAAIPRSPRARRRST